MRPSRPPPASRVSDRFHAEPDRDPAERQRARRQQGIALEGVTTAGADRPRTYGVKALLAACAVTALAFSAIHGARCDEPALPPLPTRWPKTCSSASPMLPAARRRSTGGRRSASATSTSPAASNTGQGWSTWNPDGSFVTLYDPESRAAGMIPVFSYYQLLQSKPAESGGEPRPTSPTSMTPRRWPRTGATCGCSSSGHEEPKTVVLHVEPDLWGYIEQARGDDAATVPAVVPAGCRRTPPGSLRSSSGCGTSLRRTCCSRTT